jgi:L-ascorbate metabolism protein UlaG (beta-lactamase superfamily)
MSSSNLVYLRPDVVAEPLFNRWYAWSYLLAPQSAAMLVSQAHLRMMKSFVSAPEVHVQALRNPELLGGPFLDYDESRVDAIRALIERTEQTCGDLAALAEAIRELDELLAAHESGTSLEPLYAQMPCALRGYVELVFDMRHRASFRFFEPLLYRSRYYDQSRQSLGLFTTKTDERSFVFSTPRVDEPGKLFISKPFCDPAFDALFRMRRAAGSIDAIAEACSIEGSEARRAFESLFTTAPPAARPERPAESARVRYFGHACVLVESRATTVLVDPMVSNDVEGTVPRFRFADLPERIDYVLLTHAHQDHVLFEVLIQLRHRIGTVVVPQSVGGSLVDPSLKLILQQVGFRNVIELKEMESLEVADGQITGVPFLGEHADLEVRTKLAYCLRLGDIRIFFAADSNNLDPVLYAHVAREIGPIDMLFLGMECAGAPMSWLYGPLFSRPVPRRIDETRRTNGSDCSRGLALVEALKPQRVVVYAMGQEPWCSFLTSIRYTDASKPIVESNRLVAACRAFGLHAERVFGRAEWLCDRQVVINTSELRTEK